MKTITKEYYVSVKIYNTFNVLADSKEHAENIVRELGVYETLNECDFNITSVDEVKQCVT